MKKNFTLLLSFLFILFISCNTSEQKVDKIALKFQPVKGQKLNVYYSFSVNSTSNEAITNFDMIVSGEVKNDENSKTIIDFKNDSILLSGSIKGQKIAGSAHNIDSLEGDAKLVAMPVFGLINKIYRSNFNSQFNKLSEVELKDETIADTSENKMQFLLNYPPNEVKVGDTWEKELLIKVGNKMNCSAIYTLKEIKEEIAIIAIEGKLYGKGESFGNEFSINGSLSGLFEVNLKNGLPINAGINEDFTLNMAEKLIPIKYEIKYTVK